MRCVYTTLDGRMQFTVEAEGVKAVFAELAQDQDVFEGNTCGQCDSAETVLSLREHNENQYYSKACLACGAQLSFGQHKQGGTLFAKRQDNDRNEIGKKGWYHWQQERKQQDHSSYDSGITDNF